MTELPGKKLLTLFNLSTCDPSIFCCNTENNIGLCNANSLWATDHYQPLRIFSGHLADVTCTRFHPNSNYVATGSSDRTIRLWDVLTGNCVRIFTGHKVSPVTRLCPDAFPFCVSQEL